MRDSETNYLQRIKIWIAGISSTQLIVLMFCWSWSEAIFFPIPPDVMLMPSCYRYRQYPKVILGLVLVTIIGSVLGGMVAYWLGANLLMTLIMHWVNRLGWLHYWQAGQHLMLRQGVWFLLFSSLTPIPFKILTWLSGMMHFPYRLFIITSLIGRSIRFIGVTLLTLGGNRLWSRIQRLF